MIVVTANWAIPDGSVAAPPRAGLFPRLFEDLRRIALRAGFRRDGRYRPLERIQLVLAGDTFDGLVSGRWLGTARPWERRRAAAAIHEEVLRHAWRHATRPVAAVSRLARRGVSMPAADRFGRPVLAVRVTVPVGVVVLLGDRDAALGRAAGSIASRRGIGVGSAWDGAGLRVVHGSECDPLHAGDGSPTLLESLAVDLLARFGSALASLPGLGERGRRLIRVLADGPPLDMPLRLGAALQSFASASEADQLACAWHKAVDRWHREARRLGCGDGPGVVEAVAECMHAVGEERMPGRAAADIIHALARPIVAAAGTPPVGGLTVLGHPAPATAPSVCLGPRSMRPCPHPPEVATDVACHEAVVATVGSVFPLVGVFENGEGGGCGPGWCSTTDAHGLPVGRSGGRAMLDAA